MDNRKNKSIRIRDAFVNLFEYSGILNTILSRNTKSISFSQKKSFSHPFALATL